MYGDTAAYPAPGYGQVAVDVAPLQGQVPAAPAEAPPALAVPPSVLPLRLAIHRVEGAIGTSLVSPLVRIHLVDAATGYRWGKPAGQQCVFNEKDGAAYLRTKQEPGKEQRAPPWTADSGQSSFFRPFSTMPKRRGISRDLPPWEEAFLLQVQPDQRMAFLFEVVDCSSDEILGSGWRLTPVAWGFTHCAALKPSRRKLRAQLWSYRRRHFCGRVALEAWRPQVPEWMAMDATSNLKEEDSDDIPLVVQEYLAAGIGEERPGALAAWMAWALGRSRQKWPAALEFSLDLSQKPKLGGSDGSQSYLVTGLDHTVLLRSDGSVVACGLNNAGQCDIPPLDEGVSYTQISAGAEHAVLLRSDGSVVACGYNKDGQWNIPPLDEGVSYTQIAAGFFHTVLLRSDGSVVACGYNKDGQCNIPPLDEGVSYTQVSAGAEHTVLLRSDGSAVACGANEYGRCNIPPLDEGVSFTQVSAGAEHTVLLRSDGSVVAFGRNSQEQCNIPSLKSWRELVTFASASRRYICDSTFIPQLPIPDCVLQMDFVCQGDAVVLTCLNMAGCEVLRLNARRSDLVSETHQRVAKELAVPLRSVRAVLPGGRLLGNVWQANPSSTLADMMLDEQSARDTATKGAVQQIQVERPERPQLPAETKASSTIEVVTGKLTPAGEPSPKAETVAEEEILGHLAPQNVRQKGQACILPDELLWQIPSGKRGANRMAISPASTLLAVATVRSPGSSELRIFSLGSGRLYAMCGGHDAQIQDLCWHSFQPSREGLTSPPLLISAGGGRVVLYEVPDLETPLGLGAPQLRLGDSSVDGMVNLSGTVNSVRPHPSMSTDPRCVILLCAGHFGLTLCQVSRDLQAATGAGSTWVAQAPQMQQVPLEGHHKSGYGREGQTTAPSEVLCVRFSTQANSLENVYVTDSTGHIMLYQIRYDASVGVTASRVRTYAGSEMLGTAIYGLELVTQQLLDGKRISSVQLSMADDWALVFSRDHVIRLVSLQRGVLKVEQKMLGIQCSTYSVRGTMSPDGAYVVCGSESGELLFWGRDGKPVLPPAVPQVRLAGPLMDVVWSSRHHLVACCAMDEHALPLLAFVGGEENGKPQPEKEVSLPHKPPPLGSTNPESTLLAMSGISASIDSDGHRRWADHWINSHDHSQRSALTVDEKRRMKDNILLRILDKKAEETLGEHRVALLRGSQEFGATTVVAAWVMRRFNPRVEHLCHDTRRGWLITTCRCILCFNLS
eukprot:s348_g24.t2